MEGLNNNLMNVSSDLSEFLIFQKEIKNISISKPWIVFLDASFFTKERFFSIEIFLKSQGEEASSLCVKVKPSIFFTNSGDVERDAIREDRVGRLFRGQLPSLDMDTINEENENLGYHRK